MKLQLTRNHYVAAAVVLLAGVLIGYLVGNPATRQVDTARWTREEFEELVMSHRPAKVIELVGKPYKTTDGVAGTFWYYRGIKDSLTGKIGDAELMFWNGAVSKVNY